MSGRSSKSDLHEKLAGPAPPKRLSGCFIQELPADTRSTALDAAQLGFEGTVEVLRKLLADRFGITRKSGEVSSDDPLFAIGLGLSSLDGIEFLCEVEKLFDLHIADLDWWVYETPTLANVAQHVIELSKKQHAAP
ncbi:MAG TPA: acyl carrier protein [Pirellulales bacterium]|nr:acyl carrier protein [Pirellulales bacterium]